MDKDPNIYHFRQQLYEKEKYVWYEKGTVLLYRHDLWHRGTPMKNTGSPDHMWLVMNLTFKKPGHHWVTNWQAGWAKEAYDNLWGLLPTLDEDQKAALGVPREGDEWWNTGNNRSNVAARYDGHVKILPEDS